MAWIKTIAPEQANGALKALYDSIATSRGGVADVHRVQSLNERALRAHLELYKSVVFQRSSLPRTDRERIAVVVSHANRCAYCIAHHTEAARNAGDDRDIIGALERGEFHQRLSERDRVLLSWARQGAQEPATCSEKNIEELRRVGLDDRAVLDAALTVAYFAFVNRLVLMLGVDLESDYARTCGE